MLYQTQLILFWGFILGFKWLISNSEFWFLLDGLFLNLFKFLKRILLLKSCYFILLNTIFLYFSTMTVIFNAWYGETMDFEVFLKLLLILFILINWCKLIKFNCLNYGLIQIQWISQRSLWAVVILVLFLRAKLSLLIIFFYFFVLLLGFGNFPEIFLSIIFKFKLPL